MFRPKWIQYEWPLSSLEDESTIHSIKGDLRLAEKGDLEACEDILRRSLITERLDTADIERRTNELTSLFPRCFGPDPSAEVVVWEDGRRLVGLSSLVWDEAAPRHLISGVCVFEEYRCRGGGKALLLRSLHRLKSHNLTSARLITRENLTAAKFLYPKFSSVSRPVDALPIWSAPSGK